MANHKTEKCPYLSAYGGGYIREDQWVTEKLCSLMSKRDGVELPDRFWNLSKWQIIFRRQVQLAASLLVMYDAGAIAAALKDKRLYKLRSFAAFSTVKFFSSVIDEYQCSYDVANNSEEIELNTKSTTELPKSHKRDNKLSRLKNIDVETRPLQSG